MNENRELLKGKIDDEDNGLLVITGLPRTGSTFLQALLALDPNGKCPKTWEMWRSIPPAPDGENPKNPNVIAMQGDMDKVYIFLLFFYYFLIFFKLFFGFFFNFF